MRKSADDKTRKTHSAVCTFDFLEGGRHALDEGNVNFFHRWGYARKYFDYVGSPAL